MKIVEVIWFDAQTGFSVPQDLEEIARVKPLLTQSCGYLVDENKERIVLGFMMFDGEDMVKHWQLIPRGMIKKIKVVRK